MSVLRLEHISGFNIDRVAAAAGDDPDVPRLPTVRFSRVGPPRVEVFQLPDLVGVRALALFAGHLENGRETLQ